MTTNTPDFISLQNMAAADFGAEVIYCTNDYLGAVAQLLKTVVPTGQQFLADGRLQVDGWLSQRKRSEGHDYCIIRLATPARLRGLEIDTRFMEGQEPPYAAVQACCLPMDADLETIEAHDDWDNLVKKVALEPNQQHYIDMYSDYRYTHIKLHIFPDGGISRFKAYGFPNPDWEAVELAGSINLAAATLGAKVVTCSDASLGAVERLLMPELEVPINQTISQQDGWKTRRGRTLHVDDWAIIQLAKTAKLEALEINTTGFKGELPASLTLEVAKYKLPNRPSLAALEALDWVPVLQEVALTEEVEQGFAFEQGIEGTHVRLRLHPDGGLARIRILGEVI